MLRRPAAQLVVIGCWWPAVADPGGATEKERQNRADERFWRTLWLLVTRPVAKDGA